MKARIATGENCATMSMKNWLITADVEQFLRVRHGGQRIDKKREKSTSVITNWKSHQLPMVTKMEQMGSLITQMSMPSMAPMVHPITNDAHGDRHWCNFYGDNDTIKW